MEEEIRRKRRCGGNGFKGKGRDEESEEKEEGEQWKEDKV